MIASLWIFTLFIADKIAYDEESGEWRRTYGYKRANNELDQWAIEHKEGDGMFIIVLAHVPSFCNLREGLFHL